MVVVSYRGGPWEWWLRRKAERREPYYNPASAETNRFCRVSKIRYYGHMPQEKPELAQLKDALKEAERRIAEMRAERDKAFELVEQMKEHVSDVDALIDSWIEAFEMQLGDDGKRTRATLPESINKILADAVALQKKAKRLGKK